MIRSNQDHHALSMDQKVAAACRDADQQVIELIDLLEYKKRLDRRSKDTLQELADEAQELNLGY